MTRYVFDHFELNGEIYGGPQISVLMNGNANLVAVYREEAEPPPPEPPSPNPLAAVAVVAVALMGLSKKG